jgi:hypothetical protein
VSIKTLANWRCREDAPGPPFQRFGNRILYPRAMLDAWIAARLHQSTGEYAAAKEQRRAERARREEERATLELKRQDLERELARVREQLRPRSAAPRPVKSKPAGRGRASAGAKGGKRS